MARSPTSRQIKARQEEQRRIDAHIKYLKNRTPAQNTFDEFIIDRCGAPWHPQKEDKRHAICDYIESDLPLDRPLRCEIASFLREAISPNKQQQRLRKREMWAEALRAAKRFFEADGYSSLAAEGEVAEMYGMSVTALQKKLQEKRVRGGKNPPSKKRTKRSEVVNNREGQTFPESVRDN